jgi:hypothetical protein
VGRGQRAAGGTGVGPALSPARGTFPVPGPSGTVLRTWDGQSWTDHFDPTPVAPLPEYTRQPWRFLAFPGWLLLPVYALAVAGTFVMSTNASGSTLARIGLAVSVGCATAVPAIALLTLFNRRLSFSQLGDSRRAIIAWGVASGIGSACVAILIVYAVSGEWNAPLLTAPYVPGWLVGFLHGPLKLVVPVILWSVGMFRAPRQGFLLVLLSAMTFGVSLAAADAWFTAVLDHRRIGAVIVTVLLAAIVAAVPWRAAWKRKTFFTWSVAAALAIAMGLHWLADTLIVQGWEIAVVGVAIVGYLTVKVVVRQLVPPDHVATVSPGWRPAIGTLLAPHSPLLSRSGLRAWLEAHGHHRLPGIAVSMVTAGSWIVRTLLRVLAVFAGLAVAAVTVGVVAVLVLTIRDTITQRSLDPFYAAADLPLNSPGQLLRTEQMTAGFEPLTVPGGTGYRMLYTSELPHGTVVPSGGMIFVPDAPPSSNPRPVLAWAHPTLGEGAGCAPSRSENPLLDMQPWLTLALQRGWVVVATDYAGVGTEGTPLYLVGQSEARDVMFAVAAARQFTPAQAGTEVAVFGHSQGGHSALWTGELAGLISPDLELVGVAAAAPAAELTPVFQYLWNGPQAWMLSPDVVESWMTHYPRLTANVLTPFARLASLGTAQECLTSSAVQAQLLFALGIPYTVKDPLRRPGWAEAAVLQTPAPLSPTIPMLLIQSTSDATIPPASNATLQAEWCRRGSSVDALWLSGVSHINTAVTASPAVIDWISSRFRGGESTTACAQPPPINAPPPTPIL